VVVAVAYYLAESANNNNCNSSNNSRTWENFFVSKCHEKENSKKKNIKSRQRQPGNAA